MFTRFRSTFVAKKEWKWSVTFSLLAQLRCIKPEYDWLQVERGSIIKGDHMQIPFNLTANLPKALKSEISYNFLRLSCHLRISEKVVWKAFLPLSCNRWLVENMLVWVKRPHNFKYGTGLSTVYAKWHWSIWYQIVSVSWLSSKKNITLRLAMTTRPILQPKYWILHQLLRYSCQQGLTKRASAVN